jgi:malonate decarboxylase delta subunit
MEDLTLRHTTRERARGNRQMAIIGVVASGNLEVLTERVLPENECVVEIRTAAEGFGEVWAAVVADFVERHSPGGIRFAINDGGARPDTVSLRLAQAARLMESDQ